ncbi:MAG: hypothetical protein ACJA2R_000438 [Saprospiraceae bacterium]|jgi:hypothetical protein|tara:strand:+ start:1410 stop:1565 length:156 start_codon:yes stop_codon:yes gene_type:complete
MVTASEKEELRPAVNVFVCIALLHCANGSANKSDKNNMKMVISNKDNPTLA